MTWGEILDCIAERERKRNMELNKASYEHMQRELSELHKAKAHGDNTIRQLRRKNQELHITIKNKDIRLRLAEQDNKRYASVIWNQQKPEPELNEHQLYEYFKDFMKRVRQ